MKKGIVFVLLVILASLCMGFFLVWKNVIEPKNTRLALYEITTASKYKRGDADTPDQISSWLDDLNGLKKEHLKPCERIAYYNKSAALKRRLSAQDGTRNNALPPTSLQKAAEKYFLTPPSLEMLSQIGEAEFESVMSDIQRFEAELKSNGYEGSLNALAEHPKNFSTDIKEVEDTYNRYILLAEQNLKSRFYDYDIPKGKATISEQSHRWSAYAQYNRHENTMIAFSTKAPLADYLGESEFNVAIAPFISVHEMYPGHHLSAYAGLSNPICPGDNPTSFSWLGEGWATYVEFVADEDGFYREPEHKLAWLDYRLTRAMRIILDVKRMQGLYQHAALKLIWEERMPERLSGHFDREFHRLKTSHHQHLTYIFGYKAISDAKTKLVEELGEGFDEKKFHDAILRLAHTEPHAFYETVKTAMKIPTHPQPQ